MKLYAQQGYGTGERINSGLKEGVIHGAILSPKDNSKDRINNQLRQMKKDFPEADRLFDPQYYASLMALDNGCRLGKLEGDNYSYFRARRRAELERETIIQEDLRVCLEEQAGMDLTAIIAPNIVIRKSLNSIESVIAKNFIRNATEVWTAMNDDRPLYVTLAIDAEALQDRYEVDEFLADITLMDNPPHGFYLLVNNLTSIIQPELVDQRTLAGWMMFNHALNLNGFEVINGYSDILTPLLSAAGGTAGATGWWGNSKVFSLDRYEEAPDGGRRPVFRYLSKALFNSIRFDELHRLRERFPSILNALDSDTYYDPQEASKPENQVQEIIQCWDAISSFAGTNDTPKLIQCYDWLTQAKELYAEINAIPGFRLTGRSNQSHLDALQDGINLFAQLAEIDLQ